MAFHPGEWIGQSREFLEEVRAELRKVTWPTQKEYVGGTIGVLVIVLVLTLVLGLEDYVLAKIIQLVM
ncbi:MAG TPA: preprotein translocase subunit SecE [Deltaproteobacteria bacterium]|jgi:preprotein translocase subunit SecE|nr:preprotein translocase subunit SecE [Deltaproteobacteria bacterium]